jgi:hypothetical protein
MYDEMGKRFRKWAGKPVPHFQQFQIVSPLAREMCIMEHGIRHGSDYAPNFLVKSVDFVRDLWHNEKENCCLQGRSALIRERFPD